MAADVVPDPGPGDQGPGDAPLDTGGLPQLDTWSFPDASAGEGGGSGDEGCSCRAGTGSGLPWFVFVVGLGFLVRRTGRRRSAA